MFKAVLFFVVLVFGASASPAYSQSALGLDFGAFGWNFGDVPVKARVDAKLTAITTEQDIQISGTLTGAFKDAAATIDKLATEVNDRLKCQGTRELGFFISKARPAVVQGDNGIDQAQIIADGHATDCATGAWLHFRATAPVSIHSSKKTFELKVGKPIVALTRTFGSSVQWLFPGVTRYIDRRVAEYFEKYKLSNLQIIAPALVGEFRPTLQILRLAVTGNDLGIVVKVAARISPKSIRDRSGFTSKKDGEARSRRTPSNRVASRNPN